MESPHSLHPNDRTLNDYGLGKLGDELASTVNEQLEGCADCRQRVASLTSDSFLGRLREVHNPTARSILGGSLDASTLSFMQAKASSSPPATDTLPPGLANHLDYSIKRELGRGGMGVVYLAHNSMMGRDEVLKVMGRHIMERPSVLERFQREIRAVAKLRHPNIVAAYSAFRIEGGLVFAMEYVEGLDLSKLVKAKGPLSVAHASNFIYQAALGLQHAHEKGMVHRDIKPHNLMLSHEGKVKGVVKILDFGLAKATREQKVDGGLTSEGQALGTPDYIAPEQITNALDVDIRADLYSLGGTLYYLLTGRPPFQCTSLYDIYQAHISRDAEPLNLIRPEVPAELAALVAKMMAKEPGRRFQTPMEVANALAPFYKKAAVTQKAPKPEISQVETPDNRRVTKQIKLATNSHSQPKTSSTPEPVQPQSQPQVDARPESIFESLIDIREPESSSKLAPTLKEATPRRRRLWTAVAAAMLLIGGIAAWMGGVFKVKTDQGTIVIENLPSEAEVLVDGGVVQIIPTKGGEPLKISIQPGEYKANIRAGSHKLVVQRGTEKLLTKEAAIVLAGKEVTFRLDEPKTVQEGNPRGHDVAVVVTPPNETPSPSKEKEVPVTVNNTKEDTNSDSNMETLPRIVESGGRSTGPNSLYNGENFDGWIFPFGNQDDW